jgi:hypothetical protein
MHFAQHTCTLLPLIRAAVLSSPAPDMAQSPVDMTHHHLLLFIPAAAVAAASAAA